MITPSNIPSEYMYARAAFPYTEMNSAYLKKMDEEEKPIVDKENIDIKTRNEDLQNKGIKYGFVGGVISSIFFVTLCLNGKESVTFIDTCKCLSGVSSLIGLSSLLGCSMTLEGDTELTQIITLRRADRLDEKMREITKRMQIYGKVLEEKEFNELEKAHTFFANRSLEYKTSKNKGQSTTILSQNNYLSMAQSRV